jgi:cell division initiation protein
MKMTPLDIQQVGFKVKLRGYDRREVDAFLDALTQDYEGLLKENSAYKEKLADLEVQVLEFKKKEATLNNTLMKAQDLVEDMKGHAQREGELIIKEAELKAEETAKVARERLAELRREILDLQKQKLLFIEKSRSLIKVVQRVLDVEEKEDEPGRENRLDTERDENIRLLKPKDKSPGA